MLGLSATVKGFTRLFQVNVERLSDIREPLKETGEDIRSDSRETFGQERSRSGLQWDPLADSTKKRLQQTTVGPVTIKGKVRAKYIRQVSHFLTRQQLAGNYKSLVGKEFQRLASGGSADDALDESVRGSFKKLRAALRKTEEKRRAGKRQISKHSLLGKVYSMVRLQVSKTGLRVGILNDSKLAVHNEGGQGGHNAKLPARTFIELLASDVEALAERLVDWIVADDE